MKRTFLRFLCLLLVLSFLVGLVGIWPRFVQHGLAKTNSADESPSAGPSTNYLPLVTRGFPAETMFGVELGNITISGGLGNMFQAGTSWVRRNGLIWASVEPNLGERNWQAVAGLETELKNAASGGMRVILIVRDTPTWARQYADSACGPIMESQFQAFAAFMRDAVARYSQPPYSVKYWEIYNEPDVAHNSEPIPYGCWGDPTDAQFFGGEYYGNMLKIVYPAIKSADPDAQVLVGGLLLDCDPVNYCTSGAESAPPKFLRGILKAGAGNSFDGISFHAYDYYTGQRNQFGNLKWNSFWNTTGPTSQAKIAYIEGVLANYQVSGKFLMNTEAATIWDGTCDADCEHTKAVYLVQSYVVGRVKGLEANIWYSYLGWRNSGLAQGSVLLPAYSAFATASHQFATANYMGEVALGEGVKAYEFMDHTGTVWVVWSGDGLDHEITLAQIPDAITDMLGLDVPVNGAALTVTADPLYVEFLP